jgi:ABC-type lipoprotein export system ATPase subunit
MDRPTDGEVWLNERRLDTLRLDQLAVVRRKHIGFVFQAFNLLPTLNALENVALPLNLDGIAESESSRRSVAALEQVGLATHANKFPSQLSGGEMQRVAIARALAIRPELIIADEPTGSLDSTNGRRVLDLLAELNASQDITILLATHSEEASGYASRVIHLKDGKLDEVFDSGVLSSTV